MTKIVTCDEFIKDAKHLAKKYKSIKSDMESIIAALKADGLALPHIERINNLGQDIKIPVYKMRRVWCESLKSPSKLRLIFTYDEKNNEIQLIQFLELYAKADKEVEDRNRIKKNI